MRQLNRRDYAAIAVIVSIIAITFIAYVLKN